MGITGSWKGRGGSVQEIGASLERACLLDTGIVQRQSEI